MEPIASLGVLVNVTTCNEFYVYQFDASVPKKDREYFGYNTGSPLKSHESAGMLEGGKRILEIPCHELNRTVPYFVEIDLEKQGTQNQVIYD